MSNVIKKIVGIDPGSNTLGYACIEYNEQTNEILSSHAETITITKIPEFKSKELKALASVHGETTVRLVLLESELFKRFDQDKPNRVVTESPFYNTKFPSAFGALTKAVYCIQRALMQYDPYLSLEDIAPRKHKAILNTQDHASKDSSKEAILKIKDTLHLNEETINSMDEHAVDALSVAYAYFVINCKKETKS